MPAPTASSSTTSDERLRISYSQLDNFRQCALKWKWQSVDGWKPAEEAAALSFGTAWHSVLERHYATIKALQDSTVGGETSTPKPGTIGDEDWRQECDGAVQDWILNNTDAESDTRDRLRWMYKGYVAMHGLDHTWRVLAIEIKGTTELAPGVDITYIIDLVVEDTEYGGVWVIDHKSAKALPTEFAMELDDQGGLYWWCWENDPEMRGLVDGSVNGYLRSVAKKAMLKGDVPDAIETWERIKADGGKAGAKPKASELADRHSRKRKGTAIGELEQIRRDAYNAAVVMREIRAGKLPVWSAPNPSECGWKCSFKEVHIQTRKNGGDVEEAMSDFDFWRKV